MLQATDQQALRTGEATISTEEVSHLRLGREIFYCDFLPKSSKQTVWERASCRTARCQAGLYLAKVIVFDLPRIEWVEQSWPHSVLPDVRRRALSCSLHISLAPPLIGQSRGEHPSASLPPVERPGQEKPFTLCPPRQ